MKNRLLLIFLFLGLTTIAAADNPDAIIGLWQNGSSRGHVQIFKHNGKYYGKVTWIRDTKDVSGRLRTDKKNSNPELRNRPLEGIQMLRDFVYEDGEWAGGKIYNPEDGKEYKCIMTLKNNGTLKVRGYIGFSWIGKTDIWSRVK